MDHSNNQANGIIHDLTAELTRGLSNNTQPTSAENTVYASPAPDSSGGNVSVQNAGTPTLDFLSGNNTAPSPAATDNGLPELDFLKEAANNAAPGQAAPDNGLPELDFLKEAANNAAPGQAAPDNGLPELDFLKEAANNAAPEPAAPTETSTAAPAEPPETVPAAPPASSQNPAIKYGRRMDYRTAKVDNGTKRTPMNLNIPNRLYNPLPTPKKRVPKEMDYDIQPSTSQMHFDIVDLKGMDFFDIN